MKMKITLNLLLLSLITINSLSQNNKLESIEQLLKKYNNNTPGCAIGVVKDGEFIYQKGFGMSSLDYSVSNDINTKFFIGSITKQFTGACIAYLILEEKLNPNDDIRKYIPEFPFHGDTIKIENLIHHTSGIKNYEVSMDISGIWFDDDYCDYNYLLKLIINQSNLDFKPNSKFSYSNSNYTLLAEIVKRVSGQPIEIFAEEKIFNPIGMNNSFFWNNPKKIIKDRAVGYKLKLNGVYEINHPQGIPFGSGNMISTVVDLGKWGDFLANQYNDNTDFIQIFTETCNTKDTDYESAEYAYGIDILDYRGLLKYEHNGGMLGFCSRIAIYPKNGLAIIILGNINNVPINSVEYVLSDYYLKNHFTKGNDKKMSSKTKEILDFRKEIIISIDSFAISKYEGYYKFGKGYVSEVKRAKHGLIIHNYWDNFKYNIYPISDSAFIDTVNNVRFDFNEIENQSVMQLILQESNGEKHKADKENIEETLDKEFQDKLSGFYYNSDINIVYHIYLDKGNLWLIIGNEMPIRLVVENKELISFFGYEAKIISDDKNQIEGFKLLKHNILFSKISSN
jgi:CubicO group peptidase (beta-lactamase class C family)